MEVETAAGAKMISVSGIKSIPSPDSRDPPSPGPAGADSKTDGAEFSAGGFACEGFFSSIAGGVIFSFPGKISSMIKFSIFKLGAGEDCKAITVFSRGKTTGDGLGTAVAGDGLVGIGVGTKIWAGPGVGEKFKTATGREFPDEKMPENKDWVFEKAPLIFEKASPTKFLA